MATPIENAADNKDRTMEKYDHLAFQVSDMDAAIQFYVEKLSFTLASRAVDPDETEDADFDTLAGDTVTVPMIHMIDEIPYAEGDGYQMVELIYHGYEVSMVVVLPEAGRFEEIRSELNSAWLEGAHGAIAGADVEL